MAWNSSRGASYVEFALVITLILGFMAAIAEISRYRAIQGVLIQGAQRGVLLASRIKDIQWEDTDGDQKYQRFLAARKEVLDEAEKLPIHTFLQPSTSEGQNKMLSYAGVEMPGGSAPSTDAILIRPSEFVYTEDGKVIFYPQMCPEMGPCDGSPRRKPNTRMETLLTTDQNPLMVQVRAKVKPLIPFMEPYIIEGRALGYQEGQREGIYTKPIVTPLPTPTVPSPTRTPTITPTPDPLAPTRTPTATHTVTPTPTATYFQCYCPPTGGQPSPHTTCRRTTGGCAICPNFVNQCICSGANDPACRTGGGGG